MRIIKFRGKDLETGNWVCGDLYHAIDYDPIKHEGVQTEDLIIAAQVKVEEKLIVKGFSVDPASVGMSTGLHDKYGREIYEGDILMSTYADDEESYTFYEPVAWAEDFAGFYVDDGITPNGKHSYTAIMPMLAVVVGNIHENPELLQLREPETV